MASPKKIVDKLAGWAHWRRWHVVGLAAVVLVVLAALGLIVWWAFATWQTILEFAAKDRVATQIELAKAMAQIVLGVLVLGTLWAAWRRATAAERTVEVAQEGQITERFTKAVEQLGNGESMAIRLGGIYALERIAQDSEKDHWPVMEVLTAYVRGNDWWSKLPFEVRQVSYYPFDSFFTPSDPPIPTDVQAILSVLRRRNSKYEGPGQRLDLSGASLLGANMEGANLSGAVLTDAKLRMANLRNVNLQNANLSSVIFNSEFTGFVGTDLTGSDLSNSNLRCANLQFAVLKSAILRCADLQGADLTNADLRNAIGLTQEQFDSANKDKTTKRPHYLK